MITIYEATASDFSTLGLGALTPTECTIEEKGGGLYELTLVQPFADDLRHELLKCARIIKAPSPVRETPLLTINATTQEEIRRDIYRVETDGRRLNMRTGPSLEYRVIHAYKPGTEVVRLGVDGEWAQVVLRDGGASGWMWNGNLSYVRTETEIVVEDSPGTVVQPRQTREQLFRIYEVEPDSKRQAVTARAQHISYDLKGALVAGNYTPENVAANIVCAQLVEKSDHDIGDFNIYCGVTEPVSGDYSDRNLIDCLLDPETGIVAQTHARLVRDNYDIFLLPGESRERGVELRYGKNLVSASMPTGTADLITRIRPVGKDAEGEPLYIEKNNGFVDSPRIDKYPVIYAKKIEYDVVVSDDLSIKDARTQLEEKAKAEFEAGCDLPSIRVDADFIRLELTEEYRALASAHALHLYDLVPVVNRRAGIVAKVRMTGYKYDGVLERYEYTELGDIAEADVGVYGYEIADGSIHGGKITPNSMSGDRIRNLSVGYAKIDVAAIRQLSADAVVAIRAEIRKLVAGEITTDQLYADLAEIAVAQITTANIGNANIDWAQIGKLTAEIAEIISIAAKNGDFDFARIKELLAEALILEEGVAGSVYIKNLAATQASFVGAVIGELVLKGSDGKYYEVTVQADGTINTKQTTVTNGEISAGETNGGKTIVETSANIANLNASTIKASEAIIASIFTSALTAGSITATDAFLASASIPALSVAAVKALGDSLDISANETIRLIAGGQTPVGSVKAGSSVTINKDRVSITTPEFSVAIPNADGETNAMTIDEEGAYMESLTAPDVAPRYKGRANLYVNPAATGAQIAAGTHFRSLKDACAALNGRWVSAKSVVIHLAAGMEENNNVELRGVSGGRWIEIRGDESSRAKLVGSLSLVFNACPVYVRNMNIDTLDIGLNIEGTQTATVNSMTITGPGTGVGGTRGILSQRGSSANVSECEIYDCERSLYVQIGGTISGANNKGNCRVGAVRSAMYLSGTQPCDSAEWTVAEYGGKIFYESVTVDQGTKPTPAPAPTTVSYTATGTDSFAGGGWNWYRDEDIRQGYANGPGAIRGCFWFDNASLRAALKGKTIKQASLSLYQLPGYGRSAPVAVNLEGIVMEYEGRTGTPYGNPEYGIIGNTEVGEVTEFTIPVQVVNDLVKGTINGLMVRTGETATMNGRDFSVNYARFAGKTTGTNLPTLTVAYK